MPLQETSGTASYDAFGGGAAVIPNYIEDVFSTYLYTGNGSTQTINNGIDLAGKGGLVWAKRRNYVGGNVFYDTVRGATKLIASNQTNAESTNVDGLTAFNSNGFSLGSSYPNQNVNGDDTYTSWTFRKQPKFFDVVTWTGDNTNNRAISHSLGGTVGCLIVKKTSGTGDWPVWHRSLPAYGANPQSKSTLYLNATLGGDADVYFGSTAPTSTAFYVDVAANASGSTYVAYLFAHDAGGFGLTGTDNVISCGSFTTDGSGNATVNLGYEPQWIMYKRSDSTSNWFVIDNMRGMTADGTDANLFPNLSAAESSGSSIIAPSATGFSGKGNLDASATYIYIAIRRGPMKTPTSGTSVFSPNTAASSTGTTQTTNFPVDLQIMSLRNGTGSKYVSDRLRGVITTPDNATTQQLRTDLTAAEATGGSDFTRYWNNTGFEIPSWFGANYDIYGYSGVFWNFRRAPGFFDEVCYTGTGSARTVTHNLGVAPELMIVKSRSNGTYNWLVYHVAMGNTKYAILNTTAAQATSTGAWDSATPTASVFSLGNSATNASGATYVAYLFASCPGVSKVGSYSGTGGTQTISCGFAARFVLIKRTDSTGDWYVWDTARGIVAGNDPYLLLNSTAAEVTNTDYVDAYAAGFEISSTAPAAINANGGSFIFFAVA